MVRRFKFEGDIYESLDCVPMAVRRKLDRIGVKIGLEQWRLLGRGERLAICHLPANLEEEREVLQQFIAEAVERSSQQKPRALDDSERAMAMPPDEAPPELARRSQTYGVALTPEVWKLLDDDERYALIKLGGGESVSHNFEAALKELSSGRAA